MRFEIWSFVGCKAKNVHAESPEGWGDVWTWIAIDPETKLIPAWFVGDRTAQSGYNREDTIEVLAGLYLAVLEIKGDWSESLDNWMQSAAVILQKHPTIHTGTGQQNASEGKLGA